MSIFVSLPLSSDCKIIAKIVSLMMISKYNARSINLIYIPLIIVHVHLNHNTFVNTVTDLVFKVIKIQFVCYCNFSTGYSYFSIIIHQFLKQGVTE